MFIIIQKNDLNILSADEHELGNYLKHKWQVGM